MHQFQIVITGAHDEKDHRPLMSTLQTLSQRLKGIGFHATSTIVDYDVELNMEFVEEVVEVPVAEPIAPPPVEEPVVPVEIFVEETPKTEVAEQAAVLTVRFGSVTAAKIADKHDLTDDDFDGKSPSGVKGFTAGDVRDIVKAQ